MESEFQIHRELAGPGHGIDVEGRALRPDATAGDSFAGGPTARAAPAWGATSAQSKGLLSVDPSSNPIRAGQVRRRDLDNEGDRIVDLRPIWHDEPQQVALRRQNRE